MISVNKLSKQFTRLQVLDEIQIQLMQGKSYALIGPNGSGKTTLIKSILGLVIPDTGDIQMEGKSILGKWDYRKKIGYMPQIGRYPDHMQVGQIFSMISNIRQGDTQLDEELIEAFNLKSIYQKRMHTLSGGTCQKVSAALAFLHNPPILILDEPTAGLDPLAVEILKEKVKKETASGKLLIITSHIMSDLDDLTTELIYLYEGRVFFDDTIEKLKKQTGEARLGRALSSMIKTNFQQLNPPLN